MERVRGRYEASRTGPSHILVDHDVSACRNAVSRLGGLRKARGQLPTSQVCSQPGRWGSDAPPNW
jgi:hypothetical protein